MKARLAVVAISRCLALGATNLAGNEEVGRGSAEEAEPRGTQDGAVVWARPGCPSLRDGPANLDLMS